MVEQELSKLLTGVRFPLPAQKGALGKDITEFSERLKRIFPNALPAEIENKVRMDCKKGIVCQANPDISFNGFDIYYWFGQLKDGCKESIRHRSNPLDRGM